MRKVKEDKLVMIVTDTHRLAYGTMLGVVAEHNNQRGWIAEVAETGNRVYVAKDIVREI